MPIVRAEPGDTSALVSLKVVPGARRDQIAGVLGERLKVRVAAPPEGGKANRAVCRLLAGALGVRESEVEIVAGHSGPEKTVRVPLLPDLAKRLGLS